MFAHVNLFLTHLSEKVLEEMTEGVKSLLWFSVGRFSIKTYFLFLRLKS